MRKGLLILLFIRCVNLQSQLDLRICNNDSIDNIGNILMGIDKSYYDSLYLGHLKDVDIVPDKQNIFFKGVLLENGLKLNIYNNFNIDTTFIIHNESQFKYIIKVNSNYYLPITFHFEKNKKLSYVSNIKKKILFYKENKIIDSFYLHHYIRNTPWFIRNEQKNEINTFFKIGEFSIKINKVDIMKNEIDFEFKKNSEKIFGKEHGYYLSDSLLTKLKMLDNFNLSKYYILHFYGKWCAPCMKEYPETKNFEAQLLKKNTLRLLNIECDIPHVKELNEIVKVNYIHNLKESKITLNKSGFINFFDVWQYPKYIILDSSGKVLNSEIQSVSELKEFIESKLKF